MNKKIKKLALNPETIRQLRAKLTEEQLVQVVGGGFTVAGGESVGCGTKPGIC